MKSVRNHFLFLLSQASFDSEQHLGKNGDMYPDQTQRSGYIKKIGLKNFSCYDDFEYTCVPQVNLISRPRLSGKSSILTGISVGLGDSNGEIGLKSFKKDSGEAPVIILEIENSFFKFFQPRDLWEVQHY